MIRVLTFFGTVWTFASSSNPYVFTIKDSDQQSNFGRAAEFAPWLSRTRFR